MAHSMLYSYYFYFCRVIHLRNSRILGQCPFDGNKICQRAEKGNKARVLRFRFSTSHNAPLL